MSDERAIDEPSSGRPAGRPRLTPRRELVIAVSCCVVGAGLALFAGSRAWTIVTGPPGIPWPKPPTPTTGTDLSPWLPALPYVALAGAGAIVGTRGTVRFVVGCLISLCGMGIVGAGVGLVIKVPPAPWAAVCSVAGLIVLVGGVLTLLRGGRWPGLGARFQRRGAGAAEPSDDADDETGPAPAADPGAGDTPAQMWDAMDRGDDPTDRPTRR